MATSWLRALVGIVAFFVVLIIGVNVTGALDTTADPNTGLIAAQNTIIVLFGIALIVGFIAYAVVEYAQTSRLESITSQFDTRTIVLIPIAIAINIILGQTVAAALKVPIYLDSIGTILVGVLAGPIAGALTDRIGARPLITAGLVLQATALAWLAAITAPDVAYVELVPPFAIAGVGMALFFAPVATVVLGSVSPGEAGKASGANNAIRELGGVFGVAVLASIFAHQGGYASADLFTDGIVPALWVGAAVVGVGAVAAGLIPGRRIAAARVGDPALQGAD